MLAALADAGVTVEQTGQRGGQASHHNMTDLPLARLAHNIEPRRRLGPCAQGQTAACWPGPAMSARWWLLPLPAVAARLFVSFRGAARNRFRARQSCATTPAYRDMEWEAHRIQDTQNGFEVWMFHIAFKGTIDRRSFKPGYFGDVGDVVPDEMRRRWHDVFRRCPRSQKRD
jgi:hypothetical protein